MNDERLSAALQSLPRERAEAGFTRRVLARLDGAPRRPAPARLSLAAAVAAVVMLATSLGWSEWRRVQERQATLARLEQLLEEKQALEAELESLRRLAADARPVVYLGGNEEVDLVLDLARFQRQGGFRPAGELATPTATRPADLRSAGHPRPSRAVY